MSDKIIAVVISDASIGMGKGDKPYGGAGMIIFVDDPKKNEVVFTNGIAKGSSYSEKNTMKFSIEKARELGATHIIAICDYDDAAETKGDTVFLSKKTVGTLERGKFAKFIKSKIDICDSLATAERFLAENNLKRNQL